MDVLVVGDANPDLVPRGGRPGPFPGNVMTTRAGGRRAALRAWGR